MTDTTVPVLIGACLCPGAPHEDGDFVYLRAKLGLAAGIALQQLVIDANQNRAGSSILTGQLSEGYLLHGIAAWNLSDEQGPIEVTPDTIRTYLLDDFERSMGVADRADDLYTGPVLSPLVRKATASSNTSTTNGSTSAHRNGRSKRPKRSKPSSTSTSPMAVTETTTP